MCRDSLVESIYFYFYENSSGFKHVTYHQAGGASDFFLRILVRSSRCVILNYLIT